MRIYKTVMVKEEQIEDVICNICGNKIPKDRFDNTEEYIHIEKKWGYFSNYDGEEHNIDICSNCYDNLIKNMKLPPK